MEQYLDMLFDWDDAKANKHEEQIYRGTRT